MNVKDKMAERAGGDPAPGLNPDKFSKFTQQANYLPPFQMDVRARFELAAPFEAPIFKIGAINHALPSHNKIFNW